MRRAVLILVAALVGGCHAVPATTVETTTPTLATELVGAGWSFGMCGGYCMAELRLDGAELELAGHDWTLEEPLFVHTATLLTRGVDALADLTARIDPVLLEAVYGCPDCADGGAGWVTLEAEGVESRHEFPFGQPPPELAELERMVMAMIHDLADCRDSDLFVIPGECRPVGR